MYVHPAVSLSKVSNTYGNTPAAHRVSYKYEKVCHFWRSCTDYLKKKLFYPCKNFYMYLLLLVLYYIA